MHLVDLTQKLHKDVPIYPGDPMGFSCCPALTLSKDGVNVQSVSMGSHTGTHIDAPYHFFENGRTIDAIPLSDLVGPAIVVDVSEKKPRERILWQDLAAHEGRMVAGAKEGAVVLLRTGWSQYWGTDAYFDHPFLDPDAARRIIDAGIKLVGIDTFSPDQTHRNLDAQSDYSAHVIVLGAGALIAENLTNLKDIQDGEWIVSLAPLNLAGSDGSPVRAYAWRNM